MSKITATKEDLIKLGDKQFSEKEISGIVIESMKKKLKVNKSSSNGITRLEKYLFNQ